MTKKTGEESVFKIENCRAKVRGAGNLVDCLASQQAGFCKFSLSFGNGYFCKHPQQKDFVAKTEKLQSELASESDVLKSNDHKPFQVDEG